VEALDAVFGAPADVPLKLAAELDDRSAAADAIASWQLRLRDRMLEGGARAARWARLLERSFDALGHLEQNVSARLALEVFLLECSRA
jgi:hypothetical protein